MLSKKYQFQSILNIQLNMKLIQKLFIKNHIIRIV